MALLKVVGVGSVEGRVDLVDVLLLPLGDHHFVDFVAQADVLG